MISNIKWHCLLLCFVNIKHGASSNPITLHILQLEYDVLEYVVIERLAQGEREKLKDDGLSFSDWLQSLASFWGHLYVIKHVLFYC